MPSPARSTPVYHCTFATRFCIAEYHFHLSGFLSNHVIPRSIRCRHCPRSPSTTCHGRSATFVEAQAQPPTPGIGRRAQYSLSENCACLTSRLRLPAHRRTPPAVEKCGTWCPRRSTDTRSTATSDEFRSSPHPHPHMFSARDIHSLSGCRRTRHTR